MPDISKKTVIENKQFIELVLQLLPKEPWVRFGLGSGIEETAEVRHYLDELAVKICNEIDLPWSA